MSLQRSQFLKNVFSSGNMALPGQHIVRRFAQTSCPWCSESRWPSSWRSCTWCPGPNNHLHHKECFSSNAHHISVISFKFYPVLHFKPEVKLLFFRFFCFQMNSLVLLFIIWLQYLILEFSHNHQNIGLKPNIFCSMKFSGYYYCFMEKWDIRLKSAVKNKEYKQKSFSRLAFSRL